MRHGNNLFKSHWGDCSSAARCVINNNCKIRKSAYQDTTTRLLNVRHRFNHHCVYSSPQGIFSEVLEEEKTCAHEQMRFRERERERERKAGGDRQSDKQRETEPERMKEGKEADESKPCQRCSFTCWVLLQADIKGQLICLWPWCLQTGQVLWSTHT